MNEAPVLVPDMTDERQTELFTPPPQDLPYEDGEPMESPWHRKAPLLLEACYIAAHGGTMHDYFIGCNMFLYYRDDQLETEYFKGPDFFLVKGVDGTRPRLSWKVWSEGGHYPNLIIEFLSESTEQYDLTDKKTLYEQTFRTPEYICVAPEMRKLIGWRHDGKRYLPIPKDACGYLFSEEAGLWFGSWHGTFLAEEHTWPRWYTQEGVLVPLPEEAAHQQLTEREQQLTERNQQLAEREQQLAEREQQLATERQRAEKLAARLRELGIVPEDGV